MADHRTLSDVVEDIEHSWEDIPAPARFYLQDMRLIGDLDYYGKIYTSLITLFLEHADTWRGATADLLKGELRDLLQDHS